MLAAGSAGMPRRFAAWNQEGWMFYGYLILFFGLILGAAYVVYLYNFMKSIEITSSAGNRAATTA